CVFYLCPRVRLAESSTTEQRPSPRCYDVASRTRFHRCQMAHIRHQIATSVVAVATAVFASMPNVTADSSMTGFALTAQLRTQSVGNVQWDYLTLQDSAQPSQTYTAPT